MNSRCEILQHYLDGLITKEEAISKVREIGPVSEAGFDALVMTLRMYTALDTSRNVLDHNLNTDRLYNIIGKILEDAAITIEDFNL